MFSRVKVVLDKEKDIWIEHYLNEAITEYINQLIIKDKYSDYYDLYIEELEKIIKLIGEDVVLKAYFTNNLNLIIDSLMSSTKKTRDEIINYEGESVECVSVVSECGLTTIDIETGEQGVYFGALVPKKWLRVLSFDEVESIIGIRPLDIEYKESPYYKDGEFV